MRIKSSSTDSSDVINMSSLLDVLFILIIFFLVTTTPHGTGAPMNLCPLTLMLSMFFLKEITGALRSALLTNGSISPNKAPST